MRPAPKGFHARHDAVAWGYARAADALGVDIIENCEVTAINRDAAGRVESLDTSRGRIRAGKVGVSAAGNTSAVLSLEVTDDNGNVQTYRFKKTLFGKPVSDKTFTFEAPANATVIDHRN